MNTGPDIWDAVRTLYGEARGETYEGKVAVAHVILERQAVAKAMKQRTGKNHPLFGDGSLSGVCLAPYQFSCWNPSDPNAAKLAALKLPDALGDSSLLDCLAAMSAALAGREKPLPAGCLHYFVAGMTNPPKWAAGLTPAVQVGAHVFFNTVR
jgi:N-acetylmuramoyl-L-alanine amidase